MIMLVNTTASQTGRASEVEPLLLEVADVVNTTLDLETTLRRVAELVRKVIDYEIFAILLLNEQRQELYVRFSVGYPPEVADRLRVRVGQGVTGRAAETRQAVLVADATQEDFYLEAVPNVHSELAIPLIVKNRVIGVIDIEAREKDYFTEEHKRLLTLIASRMAVGIENARLHTRTTRQARTLNRLIDYQMFSILLLDQTGEKLQHRFSQRFEERLHLKHDIPLGRGVVGYAAQMKEAVLVPDVAKNDRYIATNPETRSELAVPLIYQERVIGVLDLEHTRRGYFTEDHKRTLTTLAAQLAIAIENARLYEEIARQERRLERDLALARELQFRLLPHSLPKMPHLEVEAKFVPARAIGGDLYDFVPYSLSRLGIAIGDVSGKGAPAAIYAALVSGILRSHAPIEPGPAEMLSAVNLSLAERRIAAQFVSIIYAVWDDERRTLLVANSGLLDARNRYGQSFGPERVEAIVAGCVTKSADCVVNEIFKAVTEHAAGVDTFDDQTVVAIKVKAGASKRK